MFKKADPSKITFIPPGIELRNDCKLGMWKIGQKKLSDKPLEMAILDSKFFTGSFREEDEDKLWRQIWFITAPKCDIIPQNIIGSTLIKGESLTNFEQTFIMAQTQFNDLDELIITANFTQKPSKEYFILEWETRSRTTKDEKEQQKLIGEFRKENVALINPSLELRLLNGIGHILDDPYSPKQIEQA